MSLVNAVKEETNLAGVLKSQLSPSGTSFTARFFDTKLGTQRTPQSTTLTFMINKDGTKAERIRLSSHSTDATTGVTTCTVATNGRALPLFGVGTGSSTGNQHEPGDSIGCVTNHEPMAQLNNWMEGQVGSGANAVRIGAETDSNIYFYAQNADGAKPFIAYIAATNTWVFSNDGASSTAIGSGASAYTAGDGLSLTASDFDIDLADTTIFVQTSSGAGDSGKVARLGADGKFAQGFIPKQTLSQAISDVSVTATQINNAIGAFQMTLTALEAIDGTTTPQYVAYGSTGMKDRLMIYDTNNEIASATGTARNFGSVDALTWLGQSFVYTDALAESIKVNDLTVMLRVSGAPADNVTCSIQADNGSGAPSGTTITNGTSATIAGGTLTTAYRPSKFTWATPPTLTSGTTYWLVFKRSGANDAANFYQILDANGSTYSSGTAASYTASTLTWANIAADLKLQLVFNISYGGKICKCDADNICRSNGFGFVTSSISAAASGDVYYDRHVTYSGLTDGTRYVASTTAGALVADSSSPTGTNINAPTPHVVAGDAVGGKLKMSQYKRLVFEDDKIGVTTAVAGVSFDLLIPVGFRPDEVILKYHYNDASAAANTTGHAVETHYVGLTEVGGTYVTEGQTSSATGTLVSTGSVTAASLRYGVDATSPYAAAVTLQAIYDNAVLVRLTLDATADVLGLQQIEFIKN